MVSHLYNISFIFLTSPFMVDFIVCIRVIRVIHSTDHPLCSFVIVLFCLKKIICLHPSLCYSISKNLPVFICPYVTLSLIYSVCIVLKSLDNDVYKGLG